MSRRNRSGMGVQVSNRFSGMTALAVIGLVVATIFLVAGWPKVWHNIATFADWASTIFSSGK